MANATSATYIARTTKRATISIPSASTPRVRVTNTDAACGRYGIGDGNVEKVTKPSLGSPGHGVIGPGSKTMGLPVLGSMIALQVVLGEHLRVGALRADDVARDARAAEALRPLLLGEDRAGGDLVRAVEVRGLVDAGEVRHHAHQVHARGDGQDEERLERVAEPREEVAPASRRRRLRA